MCGDNALNFLYTPKVNRRKIVLTVEENEYIKLGSDSESSPHVHGGWHLDRLDQPSLPLDSKPFAVNFSGSNVDVYVLDSGINYEHIAFNGRAHYPGCDPVDNLKTENKTRMGRDCQGHGTHVAGLIGGEDTGVASGVTLFSVRILDCSLTAKVETLIEGLMCVIDHRKSRNGTRAIINLAIAGKRTTLGLNKALQLAINSDIIIVSSAGNGKHFRSINYNSCEVYPAGYPGVINVGATDIHDNALMGKFDNNTRYTNMGKCLDVFAPGYSILSSDICPPELSSCYNRSCKSFKSGTSQSSGIVAGAVALLLEKCPKLTHIEIKNMLRHTLSVKKVEFYKKAITFLITDPLLYDVITTVAKTRDSLLHLNLAKVNCSMYHGLPLF